MKFVVFIIFLMQLIIVFKNERLAFYSVRLIKYKLLIVELTEPTQLKTFKIQSFDSGRLLYL